MKTENILGYSVISEDLCDCLNSICSWVDSGDSARWLACINPHSYAESRKNPDFHNSLSAADWLIPDGVGVILASIVNGGNIKNRITGSDIFSGVLSRLNLSGKYSVFFLGSTPETLIDIKNKMANEFCNIRFAGSYSPPFKNVFSKQDIDSMIDAINEAQPDILWVGMTAPKQEIWLSNNICRMSSVKFAAAVGAVFDFYIGNVKRSPVFFQKLGLEWLPRFLQQPRRLWRRTFISAPIFLRDVLVDRFFNK